MNVFVLNFEPLIFLGYLYFLFLSVDIYCFRGKHPKKMTLKPNPSYRRCMHIKK